MGSFGPTPPLAVDIERLKLAAEFSPRGAIFDALRDGASGIASAIEAAAAEGDTEYASMITDNGCEVIEEMIGIAFAVIQTYFTGIRSRLVDVSAAMQGRYNQKLSFAQDPKAFDSLNFGAQLSLVPGIAFARATHEFANYWKHREEWQVSMNPETADVSWSEGPTTIAFMQDLGWSPLHGDLREAAKLCGVADVADLSPLRDGAVAWGASVVLQAKTEIRHLAGGATPSS